MYIPSMNPTSQFNQGDHPEVCRLQIERYRQMSNEQRLEIGLRMWEFAREFIEASIKNEFHGITEVDLDRKVISRMQL